MAIITEEDLPVPTPPKEPYVSERPYTGSEVDSERHPVSSLLPYIKGSPWRVDYYRQLLTRDEQSAAGMATREAIYQQYQLIKDLELRVQSALSTDFDNEAGEHSMSGTALIYPSFKPNKGDCFTADLFDGRAAKLNVTEVQQRTIFQDSTYEISYEVVAFMNATIKQELLDKVVKTTVFVREFVLNQQNPLVLEEEYEQIQRLRKGVDTLQKQYYWKLYNEETQTVPVPKQRVGTYDPFLAEFFDHAFPLNQRDPLRPFTRYNCKVDPGFECKTFWDLLVEADDSFESFIVNEFDTVATKAFRGYPVLNSLGYSALPRVLFPKGRDINSSYLGGPARSADHQRLDSPYSLSEWGEMELRYAVRRKILNGLGDVPPADLYVPLIHPVGIDDYYVLTEYFYSQAEYGQSVLELQTRALIKGKTLDVSALVKLLDDVKNWGEMECFYYIPLLSFLIRKAIGGF